MADRRDIVTYYGNVADAGIAGAFDLRLKHAIERLQGAIYCTARSRPAWHPRPGFARFPRQIFYQVSGDVVRILHIRHTARRPWTPGR
jgi:plasmid stabilization system protein ParE